VQLYSSLLRRDETQTTATTTVDAADTAAEVKRQRVTSAPPARPHPSPSSLSSKLINQSISQILKVA